MTTQTELSKRIEFLLNEAGIAALTTNLSWGETAELIKNAYSDLNGFAEACYEQNSVADMANFETADADETDMKNWDIDEEEWREAQKKALLAMAYDYMYDDLIAAEKEWYDAE